MTNGKSYREILRSSSIMGGANALEYLVALLRVKIVAVLLGPGGVGLLSLYASTVGMISIASGLGVSSSGVREVALDAAADDPQNAARTIRTVKRLCWITGLLGWLLALALAFPLSWLILESDEHVWEFALLGGAVLVSSIAAGQRAVLQGLRRIGDIARINVIAMLINTVLTVGLYYWLHEDGIVPVLLVTAAVALCVSTWFSRKVHVAPVALSLSETLSGARRLVGLGSAFMISGLLTAWLDIASRLIIARQWGIEAAGLYQAAWGISGLFAGFILSAMGTDFYPRLTAVIHDPVETARIVNEQTEIGILLALPGLLATLAFSHIFIQLFYTASFLPGAALLPWFVVGVFGRVLSWPLAFIQVAQGRGRLYTATETASFALHLVLVLWLVTKFGIIGAAYAFAIADLIYMICMLWLANRLTGFSWSAPVRNLLMIAGGLVAAALAVRLYGSGWQSVAAGAVLTMVGVIVSLRGVATRLGDDHKVAILLRKLPLIH